jgi:hypothetical protein
MNTVCSKNISGGVSIGINGVLHVLILFVFLTILYFFLIAPLEQKAFEDEISDQINGVVTDQFIAMKKDMDETIVDIITNTVNYSYEDNGNEVYVIDEMIDNFDTPDKLVSEHNKWVKITAVTLISFITISLIIYLLTLKNTCGKDTGIVSILKENLFTFVFVGLVEYLFFTKIAFKFVPAPPSVLLTTMIETFNEILA